MSIALAAGRSGEVIATSVHVMAKGLPCEGKSDFCPQGTRASHTSPFPQIPQTEYLRELRQKPSESLLWPARASTAKGSSPLHLQSDQILQFLICVFRNLMLTSSAAVHTDWRA